MPIYEYKCKKCGKTFEAFLRNAKDKVKCEYCGSGRLEKLFSLFLTGGTAKKGGSGGSCSSCSSGSCGTCSH